MIKNNRLVVQTEAIIFCFQLLYIYYKRGFPGLEGLRRGFHEFRS